MPPTKNSPRRPSRPLETNLDLVAKRSFPTEAAPKALQILGLVAKGERSKPLKNCSLSVGLMDETTGFKSKVPKTQQSRDVFTPPAESAVEKSTLVDKKVLKSYRPHNDAPKPTCILIPPTHKIALPDDDEVPEDGFEEFAHLVKDFQRANSPILSEDSSLSLLVETTIRKSEKLPIVIDLRQAKPVLCIWRKPRIITISPTQPRPKS